MIPLHVGHTTTTAAGGDPLHLVYALLVLAVCSFGLAVFLVLIRQDSF